MDPNEYTKLAHVEDTHWHFHTLHDHIRRALASHLPRPDARILDAGCGTGGLIRRLQGWHPGARIEGIDFSPLAVECARRRVPECEIREGSVTNLPCESGAFDAIVSADVVCQVDRPAEAYAEFRRCLKPGGLLVINVPAYRWMWSYHDDTCQTRHRFTRGAIGRLASESGFTTVRSTYWNTLPFPLIALRRKLLPAPAGGSDVHEYPGWVSLPMRGAMSLESAWLGTGMNLPFGCSVFAVAVKSLESPGAAGA